MKYFFSMLVACSVSTSAFAIAVVDTKTCSTLSTPRTPFILVLKKDQEIPSSILQCLKDANIASASLSGVGALKNPTLAYYDLKNKKYFSKKFSGIYELISLNGNATFFEKNMSAHLHVGLSNHTYTMISGHLQSAKIGVTGEITVVPFENKITRKANEEIGLNLISA